MSKTGSFSQSSASGSSSSGHALNKKPGLLIDASDEGIHTRTTILLTTEEARELRDALTRTIEIAEATE